MKNNKLLNLLFVLSLNLVFQACDIEDLPLYRVKLVVHTASKTHAATDDPVYVRLQAGASKYYLDYGRNDFERNKAHSYELVIPGISTLGDIEQIQIGKEGSNGLCIEKVELFINADSKMFSKNYGNSSCHWLDNSGSHSRTVTFDYDDLRDGGDWTITLDEIGYPETFTASTMENMVESIVGDQLKHQDFSSIAPGLDVKWGYKYGSEYVTIARKNSTTQKVDLDLKLVYSYDGLFGRNSAKFALDMDMEFKYQCRSGSLKMDIQNVSANASLKDGSLLARLLWLFVPKAEVKEFVTDAIVSSGMVDDMSQDFGECPTSFNVDSYGNLDMDWPEIDIMDFL